LRLKNYSEIVGTLTAIKHDVAKDVLSISTHWDVELPKDSIEEKKVDDLIGKKIGIFNAGDDRYKIRSISNKKVRGKSPW